MAIAVNWPVKTSPKGAYLEDQGGLPFLIVGEAAWSIAAQLNPSEVIDYLNNRQSKGFTAIMVNAIEHRFAANAPRNYAIQHPFVKGSMDWSIRNEFYWSHVDFILSEAKKRNILVLLFPAYIGYKCESDGWCQEMIGQDDDVMAEYGEWLGKRYCSQENIIWVHGGDANASVYPEAYNRVAAIANGIRKAAPHHLHTAHSAPERSALDDYGAIIDLNTTYSYKDAKGKIQNDYQREGAIPFIYIEGYYENEHSSKTLDWQRQALSAYLGGALLGHVFGNCPIWHFGGFPSWCGRSDWRSQLESAGSQSMTYIGRFIRSRDWWKFEPDYSNSVVTSGRGSGLGFKAAARASDGKTVIVWFPDTTKATVDLSKVSGREVKAYWWNPGSDTSVAIGKFAAGIPKDFKPPAAGMVLVVDEATSGFAAPGKTNGISRHSGSSGGGGCFLEVLLERNLPRTLGKESVN